MDEHGQYYRRQLEAELEAAERSKDDSVAQIHRALADAYRSMMADSGADAGRAMPAYCSPAKAGAQGPQA